MERAVSILIVDDEDTIRSSLTLNLEQAGYGVRAAACAREALESLRADSFDIVLCDFKLPDMDGIGFIKSCSEMAPQSAIVLMSGFGSNAIALDGIRAGARDYLSKPFTFEELLFVIHKLEEREKLREENEELKSVVNQKYSFANIIAHSRSMREIFETVKRLANFNTTVLITGESGTGKELLARAIHHNSPRRGKPFIAINCGAIPENLLESELFGHKKGSFTDATRDKRGLFEEASGGTIFLDEIGEMPPHLQVKILRTLQEQQIRPVGEETLVNVDVRVIAATLRDLEDDVVTGRFRDDLYYRLNVVSIHIPPLRERPEDIPVLIQHFMKKHNKRLGLGIKTVVPEALKAMTAYGWKGNVRELENCIERALVLTDSDAVDLDTLPLHIRNAGLVERNEVEAISDDNLSIKQRTKSLEISLIRRALKQTAGNRTRAAKILEISHRALLYKLKEYGLGGEEK